MPNEAHLAAIVPMRHTSERVVGKNYRPLGGRPLFHHIVSTLLSVPQIDEVAIDTDSPLIAEDAQRAFPGVRIIDRPAHLRGANVPMNDILLHDVDILDADLYLQTHSTNPLLSSATITAALEAFSSARDRFDSLFTVTPLHTRLWTPDGEAINHDPAVLLRTQDLPPVMEENSCLYVFDAAALRTRGNRIGTRPLLYPLSPQEAWDIDEEVDWTVVEALYAAREAAT
jgi:CMP-N-acetylneuraminic acid synthetase